MHRSIKLSFICLNFKLNINIFNQYELTEFCTSNCNIEDAATELVVRIIPTKSRLCNIKRKKFSIESESLSLRIRGKLEEGQQ